METEQSTDEQTRRRKGKSAIVNRQEEVGSAQEEGIDVQRRIRNRKEEVEAQQGGIDGESRKGKPVVGNPKEAKMSDSEVEQEVQRLWEYFAIATKKNPYLELTGPSRAIVVLDPVHFEVMLQVKGSVQSEDKVVSFLVVKYDGYGMKSRVLKRLRPNKLSTVELTFGSIVRSVEATISVQVVGGLWPGGFGGEFTASTTSLDDMKIQLLAFGDGQFHVAADGMIKLSRRVVSVELKGELRVSVKAVEDQAVEWSDSKVFRAQRASRCKAYVEVGSCKMKVIVAWYLLSDRQYFGGGSAAEASLGL
ncbi:hypothetical protein ACQ4PT_028219 [Festuca glaucescens]